MLGPFRVHHPSLSQWVTKQRRHQRLGKLSKGRIARLEAVGFEWEGNKRRGLMDPYVDALAEYKRKHSHVWVTPGDDPVLGKWVQQQIALMQQGALEPRLERALVALGLPLTWDEQRWERLFAALCLFRRNHGHLRVPDGNELSKWLHAQERLRRDGELEMDRELRLRELGLTPK